MNVDAVRAFWIAWYDLPDSGRDAYFSWLHGTYIPKVLKWPGVAWAAHYASEENVIPLGGGTGRVKHHAAEGSVPTGDRFILIFGGREAHVFANPSPGQFHAQLPEADKTMLSMRVGERINIMLEEATVHGPEAGQPPDPAPSACIQLGSFNSGSYEDEDEMAAWYAQWRLPSLKTVPGVVRVRKLVSVSGWAKHACFYEFTSVAARNEHFVHYEQDYPEMEAWSKKVVQTLVHMPRRPNLARRLWPPAE